MKQRSELADAEVIAQAWRALSQDERDAVEAEARSLPLPGPTTPIRITWAH